MAEIKIKLTEHYVGSLATVTDRGYFMKRTNSFVCVVADEEEGAQWENVKTGRRAPQHVEAEINRRVVKILESSAIA